MNDWIIYLTYLSVRQYYIVYTYITKLSIKLLKNKSFN